MTLAALFLSAVTIAFPSEGARLPKLAKCYVIGATDDVEKTLTVAGHAVAVSRTGAWGALIDVVPGKNVLEVGGCRRTFYVDPPATLRTWQPPKPYLKLEYAVDAPRPRSVSARKATIVLDAGHGGTDTGAVSPHGLPEKDANLRLARAVRFELEMRGFRVVMTRDDDSFPALYDRPKVAQKEKAAAFVSLHHNAPGYSIDPIRSRYQAVYAWNDIGERLAKAIVRRMAAANPTLPSRGVLHANFAVTRNSEIPSCLVEADFVTHPDGESAVWNASRRVTVAAAIADGIADWVAGR